LVVDASPTSRRITSTYARSLGLRCVEACSVDEAVELARHAAGRGRPFDVALLDAKSSPDGASEVALLFEQEAALASTRTVLLTTFAGPELPERPSAAGIDAWCSRPLKADKLEAALRRAIETDGSERARATAGVMQQGLHVLLAEDEDASQSVAILQLEKLGCRVDAVSSGREAVEAIGSTRYDVVLMDCQMPELSGYEATRIIREREASTGGPHIPIVALAANAQHGDRQRCLRIGMDDYLAKPIRQSELRGVLEHWQGRAKAKTSDPAKGEQDMEDTARDVLDLEVIETLKSLGGDDDPGLFAEIVELFLQDTPPRLAALEQALGSSDAKVIEETAHSLKSSCGNLGAIYLSDLCRKLEAMGQKRDLSEAEPLVRLSREEFERVTVALREQVG
jgi:CheY-like chemotaxis protein